MLVVGNDIVDLTGERTGKHLDKRFLKRVFTKNEKELIEYSSRPDKIIWMIWAAKESAYKIISKIYPQTIFSHKKFEVNLECLKDIKKKHFTVTSNVRYKNSNLEIEIECWNDKVSAKGFFSEKEGLVNKRIFSDIKKLTASKKTFWSKEKNIDNYFSSEEKKSIRHPSSALVRYMIKKDISSKLGIEVSRLRIIRPSYNSKMHPPFLMIDEKKSKIDISFSHHGRWISWVWAVPALS